MNSFDEASFLMQSSGLEGGASVSVRFPLPAVALLFQRPLAVSPNRHTHTRAWSAAPNVVLNELGGPF